MDDASPIFKLCYQSKERLRAQYTRSYIVSLNQNLCLWKFNTTKDWFRIITIRELDLELFLLVVAKKTDLCLGH